MSLYRVEALSYKYPSPQKLFRSARGGSGGGDVLSDVSFTVSEGEVFGIVGGSGSGKTTLISLLCGVITPPRGTVFFAGRDIAGFTPEQKRNYFGKVQLVFQDPKSSFNPHKTIGQTLHAALRSAGCRDENERREKITDALSRVRLGNDILSRLPREVSGGQRQRAAIARALSLDPEVLILDEPVSALDVSVQAGVMNTLKELFAKRRLTALLVAHDLAVVDYMADRAAVLCGGRVAEIAGTDRLFSSPQHPYTKELIAAVPVLRSRRGGESAQGGVICEKDGAENEQN